MGRASARHVLRAVVLQQDRHGAALEATTPSALSFPLGIPLPYRPGLNCQVGHTTPGWRYGAEVELADVRMYVHGSAGPLPAARIRAIAGAPPPPY